MNAQKKSVLYSVFGGLFIIVFWVYINQIKSESQLQFWDILDLANGTNTLQLPVQYPLGPYHDGTYQASSPTPWGDLTISIIVKGGKWSNIRYLQLPESPPSQYASSYLAQQALQAQNTSIDGVSGATYTTEAFRDNLNQIVQQSKV